MFITIIQCYLLNIQRDISLYYKQLFEIINLLVYNTARMVLFVRL